jgi:quercetin dioxygenase-like cupin family protein
LENTVKVDIYTTLSLAVIAASAAIVAPHAAQNSETAAPLLQQPIANIPGKSFTSAIVTFPPGVKAAPHRHGDAFVYAYVLAGEVRSQLDDAPAVIYRAGESWYEPPGAHHRLTENTSATEPAKLLVVFIGKTGEPLKTIDKP